MSILFGAPALGETRSVDASVWAVSGNTILLRVIEPDPEEAPMTSDEWGQYILSHYGARANGGNCDPVDLGFDIGKITPMTYTQGERRYEMILHCPAAKGITLIDHAQFAEVPNHTSQALITIDNGPAVRQVFSASHQEILLPAAPVAAIDDIGAGFGHFWHSPDRILLVLGLLALCGLGRSLLFAAAGAVLGCGAALSLAALDIVQPILAHGEWMIAFVLVLLAAELAGRNTARPPLLFAAVMALLSLLAWARGWPIMLPLAGGLLGAGYLRLRNLEPAAAWLWAIPAGLFGLADGLSYWPDLALLGKPAAGTLALFDFGALLAAILLWALVRGAAMIPIIRRGPFPAITGAALAGLGIFLLLTRL